MESLWQHKPFLFWLYAYMCKDNQPTEVEYAAQLALLEFALRTLPEPKNRMQKFVHSIIAQELQKRIDTVRKLLALHFVVEGFIPITGAPITGEVEVGVIET